MSIGEDEFKNTNNNGIRSTGKRSSSVYVVQKKNNRHHKSNNNKNSKQIFLLSFDALKERKARSALTILMVIVGSGLMVALNGMSAGQAAFTSKQLGFLAPNVLFVSPGQNNFRGPSSPPTIIFNSEVVNRLKSLPYVQDIIPSYSGQLQLNARGNIVDSPVYGMDPSKIYIIIPSLQLVTGSSIQPNNPSGMLVGDGIANPPGMTTPFLTVGQTVKEPIPLQIPRPENWSSSPEVLW